MRASLPELPAAMASRFQTQDGLPADAAAVMTQSLAFARYYEAARDACGQPKLVANWLMGELSKRLNAEGQSIAACPIGPSLLGALVSRVVDGTMSNNAAKLVLDVLWAAGTISGQSLPDRYADRAISDLARVDETIEAKGLKQMNDSGALEAIVAAVLAANAKSVEEYRAGKDKAFNALVGQVMKASQGKANPAQASELLKKRLG